MDSEKKRLQEHADKSLPFLRQEMVRKLIKKPQSSHIEAALQSTETFLLPPKGPYTVGVASLYWNASLLPEDPSGIQQRILQEFKVLDPARTSGALFGFDILNWLVFIIPGDYNGNYRKNRGTIDRLSKELQAIAGDHIDLRIGIGETAKTIADVPHAYQTAFQAGMMQFYREDTHPYFYQHDIKFGAINTEWEDIRQMRDELRRGEIAKVKERIYRHTDKAMAHKDRDTARVKDTFFQFLLVILEAAVQQGVTDQTKDTERRYIWREIDAISSLSKLQAYVLSFLIPLEDVSDDSSPVPGKLREIMRYIHGHFHEKGFTIQAIADHVNLSLTYLCAYFKKQRDQTIKEFINETRFERAKELLRNRELKLYEVAVSLGFADANYFATFFKRCAGCTPTEYRERTAK